MADLSGLRERLARRYVDAGADAARDLEAALQEAAPVGEFEGGETRRLTHVDPRNLGGPILEWLAHSDTPQAGFTNSGTRAHGPVTAPFLVFRGFGGHIIRTRWVAGVTATHWFDDVVREGWNSALVAALERTP